MAVTSGRGTTDKVASDNLQPTLAPGPTTGLQGLDRQRERTEANLLALQAKLQRWAGSPPPRGKRPTVESTKRVVAWLLRGREPGPYLRYGMTADTGAVVRLE